MVKGLLAQGGRFLKMHPREDLETALKALGCRRSVSNAALQAFDIFFRFVSAVDVLPLVEMYMLPKLQAYMQRSMSRNPESRTA